MPRLKLLNLLYDVTPTKCAPPTQPPHPPAPRAPLLQIGRRPPFPSRRHARAARIRYISAVLTEVGVIPPTSVPVVIREDAARAQLASRA